MSTATAGPVTWLRRVSPTSSGPRSPGGRVSAVDIDFSEVTFHPVLIAVAVVFAVCAIYLLFLRNMVMWGPPTVT